MCETGSAAVKGTHVKITFSIMRFIATGGWYIYEDEDVSASVAGVFGSCAAVFALAGNCNPRENASHDPWRRRAQCGVSEVFQEVRHGAARRDPPHCIQFIAATFYWYTFVIIIMQH